MARARRRLRERCDQTQTGRRSNRRCIRGSIPGDTHRWKGLARRSSCLPHLPSHLSILVRTAGGLFLSCGGGISPSARVWYVLTSACYQAARSSGFLHKRRHRFCEGQSLELPGAVMAGVSQTQNADQIAYWNGPGGQRWADRQRMQDELLQPVSTFLLDCAKAMPGERIIDVGCGCGGTTRAFAEKVGASGYVLGIDISAPMLERARQVAPKSASVEFLLADA